MIDPEAKKTKQPRSLFFKLEQMSVFCFFFFLDVSLEVHHPVPGSLPFSIDQRPF